MGRSSSNSAGRRAFLRAGTTSLFGGLACARALAAETGRPREQPQPARPAARAKRCILVYLLGGPSHLDTWDLKPEAPREIRGPFQPIDSNVAGIQVCEHLPRLSRQVDRLAVVRSAGYANNDHPYMIYHTLTGRTSPVPLGANTVLPPSRNDHPHMGSVVSRFAHTDRSVPAYVAIPEVRVRMAAAAVAGGGRAGFLGPRFEPLAINEDPCQPLTLLTPPDGVGGDRFSGREQLLTILDGQPARSRRAGDYESIRETAIELSRHASGGGLFDLDAEPAGLRDRYGRHRFGQSLLLARRLIERGVSFVGVHFNYMSKCDGWDTHKNNFTCLKGELLPLLDGGLSALLDDLAERGLLEETLVVTLGEFGRTPKINANAGRDHWGPCGSVVFAGGGVRGGQVVGASDATGAHPVADPFEPADIVATIYQAFGLDPEMTMYDHLDRPLRLSDGRAVTALF